MTHDGDSHSQSTLLAVRPTVLLPEAFEDVGQKLRLDPLPVVGDDDLDVRVGALKSYLNAPAIRREFDRIGKQVPYDLLQPLRVTRHRVRRRVEQRAQVDPLGLRRRADRLDGGLDDRAELEWGDVQAHLAGN